MKNSPFLVFILPTLGLLAVGQVITRNFAKTPPASLHASMKRHGLTQNAVLAEKEVSAEAELKREAANRGNASPGNREPAEASGNKSRAEVYQPRRPAAPNYDKLIIPFVRQVKSEELIEAEETLASIEKELPLSIRSALHLALDSAREARKVKATARVEREKREEALAMVEMEKERRMRSVAEAKEETEKVDKARIEAEQHLVKIQADSADRLNTSIEELNQAAEAARVAAMKAEKSVRETARLIANSTQVEIEKKPAPEKEAKLPVEKPKAKMVPPVKKITLPRTESVSFALNSSSVSGEFDSILEQVASELKAEPGIALELRGFTDSLGDPAYNAALSRSRSENVKKALIERGISADRIKVLPFGATKSPEGHSENHRRVDLVFVLQAGRLESNN